MTFIAGYIYRDTVNIIADSAETLILPSPILSDHRIDLRSSFGEQVYIGEDRITHEAAQKIYTLSNSIILTFSGDVQEGKDAVQGLKYQLFKKGPISKNVLEFFNNNPFTKAQFIIGFTEENRPHIYHYHSPIDNGLINEPVAVWAGVCDEGHAAYLTESLSFLFKTDLSTERVLICVIGALQAFNLFKQSVKSGIGGYFNGISLSPQGIEWAHDTYHFLYSAKNFEKGDRYAVFRYNRDNATFVISSNGKWIFNSEFEDNSWDDLKAKWGSILYEAANEQIAKYYIMMSYDQLNIVIIDNGINDGKVEIKKIDNLYTFQFNKFIAKGMFYDRDRNGDPPHLHLFANFL